MDKKYVVIMSISGSATTRNPVVKCYAGMDSWTTNMEKALKVTKIEAQDYSKEFQNTFNVGKNKIFPALFKHRR